MKVSIKEITLFGLLGTVMFVSKIIMDALPNIHLIGVFIVAITVVFRVKALYPVYIFVFLTGLMNGFGTWWVSYLYVWTVLWGAVMLIPRFENKRLYMAALMAACSLHGFLYGILCSPVQAFFYGYDFKATVAWIIAGLPFDAIHGVSNLICGCLIMPMIKVLKKAKEQL